MKFKDGVTLGLYLSANEAALIRRRAEAADRSVSAEIRRALRSYFQEKAPA